MTKRCQFITVCLSLSLIIVMIITTTLVIGVEPDVWWHLKFGQELLAGRSIDGIDTWSWVTNPDGTPLQWVQHEWLFALLLAVLNKLPGGLYLPALFSHAVVAYYLLRRLMPKVTTPWQAILLPLFATLGSVLTFNPSSRPHSLGVLCVLGFIHLLYRYVDTQSYKYIFAYVGLTILCTNLWGGSVLLSVCILGTYLVQLLFQRCTKQFLRSFPAVILTTVACFLTPAGWKSVLYRFFNSADQSLVSEWKPATFMSSYSIWIIILIVLLTLYRNKLQLFEWFLAGGSFVLAATWARFVFFPYLVSAFLLIRYMDSGESIGDTLEAAKTLWTSLVTGIVVFTLFTVFAYTNSGLNLSWGPISQELVQAVKSENPDRLYTLMGSGNLILNDIPVFVDSRADPYAEFYTSTLAVEVGLSPFSQLNEEWDFDYALLSKSSEILEQFSEHTVVGEDDYWIFYKLK